MEYKIAFVLVVLIAAFSVIRHGKEVKKKADAKYRQSNAYKQSMSKRKAKRQHIAMINKQLRTAKAKDKQRANSIKRIDSYKQIADKYNKTTIEPVPEQWKDIQGYEGLYRISNYGDVYSLIRNKVLNQMTTTYGYLQVNLHKDKKQKTIKVHRLVASAYIDNKDNKPEVNHIDTDRTNNTVSNLEWCTRQENTAHRVCNSIGLINK